MIKSVGRHGIGKLSVAALPGLTNFRAVTSTGSECYEFETDSLLEDHPIIIKKNSLVPPQGTLFEITLRKDQPILKLAQKLSDILFTYVSFLPISIRFFVNDENWPNETSGKSSPKQEWAYPPECYGRSYNLKLNGNPCEIVLGIGTGVHEIYQNRVFISSKYNLFSFGNPENIWIPNLMIRADSEAFELPFGRHCLCNEDILVKLTGEIREKIVPAYFDFLTSHFDFRTCSGVPQILEKTDELTIGLLKHRHSGYTWSHYPVFRMVEGGRFSMMELDKKVMESKSLYLEAQNCEGTDLNHFNAPVLSLEQPAGTLKLLESLYGDTIVNLNNEDTVIEMPLNDNMQLSKEQKRFESFLAFARKSLTYYPCKMKINGELFVSYWEQYGNKNNKVFMENGCRGLIHNGSDWDNITVLCKFERVMKTSLDHFLTGGHNAHYNLEDFYNHGTPFVPEIEIILNADKLSVTISRDSFYLDWAYYEARGILIRKLKTYLLNEIKNGVSTELILANQFIFRNEIESYLANPASIINNPSDENKLIEELATLSVYRINGRSGKFSLKALKEMKRNDLPFYFSPERTNLRWLGGSFKHDYIVIPEMCRIKGGAIHFFENLFSAIFKDTVNLDTIRGNHKKIMELVEREIISKESLSPKTKIIGIKNLNLQRRTC